jgi:hypothetical protein
LQLSHVLSGTHMYELPVSSKKRSCWRFEPTYNVMKKYMLLALLTEIDFA